MTPATVAGAKQIPGPGAPEVSGRVGLNSLDSVLLAPAYAVVTILRRDKHI